MRKLVFGLLVLITACGGEIEFASERMEDHPDCPGGGVEIIMDGETEVICDGQDGAEGPEGPAGQDGKDGEVCTLEGHDADGVMEIDCPDGTDPAQLPSVGWCDVYHGDFEPDDIVELVDFYRAGCTEVTGDVYINGGWRTPHFNALEDLHYFDHLEEVGGALSLRNLDNLTVIEEFPALETIGSHLRILDNESLEDITGFDALESIGEEPDSWNEHDITGNPKLSCDVITNLLDGIDVIGSDLVVEDNEEETCDGW